MLEKVKLLLGLNGETDDGLDERLNLLISLAASQLKTLLGGLEPPESMDYIIIGVTVKKFNRLGSEGYTSHTVEGESISFSDDEFAQYEDDIQTYLSTQKEATKGKVRFL